MAVFKILKEGETDINSTDISKFAIHSDYPNVKIKFAGKANFTMFAGDYMAEYIIPHNLGYIPIVFGWLERSGRIYPCNTMTGINDVKYGSGESDICSVMAVCTADTTNVHIIAHNKFPVDAPAYDNYVFTAHWRIAVDEF